MNENNDKQEKKPKLSYLERKYGSEPKLTAEELKNPRWH